MDRKKYRPYIGHPLQLGGIRHYEMKSGKAKGVELFEVYTGAGLQYAVLNDRCLDIGWASFKGVNFSYLSNTDVVAPQYFDHQGDGYLKGFFVGLLSTCGLTYAGAPCTDGEKSLGLHGQIGNVPASESGHETIEKNGTTTLRMHGRMNEAKFFGENLSLTREITSPLGENRICIRDRVRNNGFRTEPFQILYHVNFGYPLLCEDSELIFPARSVTPRNAHAAGGIADHQRIEPPQADYEEQCFYIDLKTDDAGYAYVAILNQRLGFGVYERFKKSTLPRFTQWKQMGQGAYVMGLEPGNCLPDGRDKERQKGNLLFLAPDEEVELELEIGVLDGIEEMNAFREKMKNNQ